MLKSILAALALSCLSTTAFADSGSCNAWAETSVLAEVVLEDLNLMLSEGLHQPA